MLQMSKGCKMPKMFSEMPFMYGMVAVVIGVAVSHVSVVVGVLVFR